MTDDVEEEEEEDVKTKNLSKFLGMKDEVWVDNSLKVI